MGSEMCIRDSAEVALRDAFGDDKMVQLTAGVDNTFSIDFKKASGDGKSSGLPSPIVVDLHADSIVTKKPEDGMKMDTFLSHAQRLITNQLNSYIQDPADSDGVDATKVNNIGADGKIFKKVVANTAIDIETLPTNFDVLKVSHFNPDINTGNAVERYLGYSNVANQPFIKAYDNRFVGLNAANGGGQIGANNGAGANLGSIASITADADGYLTVKLNGTVAGDLEVMRFQQNDLNAGGVDRKEGYIALFGSDEIAIKSRSVDANNDTVYQLDFIVPGGQAAITALTNGIIQEPIKILAKPSDFIEAYLEDTEGLVEGVRDVFYSNKIVVREIGDAAKRNAADESAAFAGWASDGGFDLALYGLKTEINDGAAALLTTLKKGETYKVTAKSAVEDQAALDDITKIALLSSGVADTNAHADLVANNIFTVDGATDITGLSGTRFTFQRINAVSYTHLTLPTTREV